MSAPTIVPPFAVDFSFQQSPFAAPAARTEVPDDAPEGSYTYELVASAPAVVESECEAEVKAARDAVGRLQLDSKGASSTAMSALAHVGLLAALALFMPPLSLADESVVAEDQRYLIQQALQASAERDLVESTSTEPTAPGVAADLREATNAPSPGKAGAAGNPDASQKSAGRLAVEGPAQNDNPHLARAEALKMARDFGMIGILGSTPDAPTSRWGGEEASGQDPMSANGNMWADDVGDGFGPGGLALTSDGDGSDGKFSFIGLPGVRTIGQEGAKGMFAGRPGRPMREHKSTGPIVGAERPLSKGTLPPELIQRTVRQNFGRFRACYETGLRSNPSLAGRVAVHFVIGRDGSVSSVGSGGSDLADPGVVACVTRSFYGLSFAPPESGIVTVVYPIVFSPGS